MVGRKPSSQADSARIDALLELFSMESEAVRNELSSILPAYNDLMRLHAKSFEEFALLAVAKKEGLNTDDPIFSFESVSPPCPSCREKNNIRRIKQNKYICRACNFRYAANWKSISSDTNCSSIVWIKVLRCLLEHFSIERTCNYCGISRNTYYNIRNRLFYAMQLVLADVKLYGNVECDNTFVRVSYKGMDLAEQDYPEGSAFDTTDFKPRLARERGGSNKHEEISENSLCVFTAIDDRGHVFTKLVGFGAADARRLKRNIGEDWLLRSVPGNEPFPLAVPIKRAPDTKEGDASLLISDAEGSIARYAKDLELRHEKHVFRKDGVQRRIPSGAHDIQHVNSLGHRLKAFLRRTNYVSSKYLPGFLILFNFIENTGASDAAIQKLFCVLAAPGFGKPKTYYDEMYAVPNYLEQWLQADNPLKRFSYQQILAYYLYCQRRDLLEAGQTDAPTIRSISEQCGYTDVAIRRIYKNLSGAGYDEMIRDFFAAGGKDGKALTRVKEGKTRIAPEWLSIYDEWAENRRLRPEQRPTAKEFAVRMSEKYKICVTPRKLIYRCEVIERLGLRPPLPEMFHYCDAPETLSPTELLALRMREEYVSIRKRYREKGQPIPPKKEIIKQIALDYGCSASHVKSLICQRATEVNARIKRYDSSINGDTQEK